MKTAKAYSSQLAPKYKREKANSHFFHQPPALQRWNAHLKDNMSATLK